MVMQGILPLLDSEVGVPPLSILGGQPAVWNVTMEQLLQELPELNLLTAVVTLLEEVELEEHGSSSPSLAPGVEFQNLPTD